MAQLNVRNLDERLVAALRRRAARHGHSAEAEHRAILQQALEPELRQEGLKELLLAMPDVGEDADFRAERDLPREIEL